MYVDTTNSFGGGGWEPPRKEFTRSSKGYPETRDPAAAGGQGLMHGTLGASSLHRLRQQYGPALK
jgi:hypothetical protein